MVSLKDELDLGTAVGRLMANVLASLAQFESELRAERVLVGQAKARAAGKTWGGSAKGRLLSITEEQVAQVLRLNHEGVAKSAIDIATQVRIYVRHCCGFSSKQV